MRVVITHLQRALNSRLQTHAYDHRTTRKLINAQQILECIQEQMSELDFLCLNKESKSMRDVAEIRRGRTIRFYDLAFSWQGYFTPVITHEISHLCGTNDRHYFHHSGQNPNMAAHKRWDKIASLYQWWVAKGFCVPGDDC